METKANYTLVGFFTLLVMVAAFGFVYWMATFGRSGELAQLEIRIPGSASGLSVGAPVLFNGIRIGSVRSLTIDGVDPNFVLAMTEVRATAPVYENTKAKLGIQGLTGQSHIELSAGKPETGQKNILEEAAEKGSFAVLTADESSVTNLLATAEDIMARASKAVAGVEEFVETAKGPLIQTAENAEKFSAALADNSDGISDFLKNVSSLSSTIEKVSGTLESTITKVEALVSAVEPQRVSAIVQNAEKVSVDVANASSELKPLLEEFRTAGANVAKLSEDARASLAQVDKVIASVDGIVGSVDATQVGETVENIAEASAQAREGIDQLVQVANTIGNRNQDINNIITNANQLTARLNEAALQVQTTLKKLDGFLGSSGDTSGLVAEAKKTLQTIQDVANKINQHIGPIASNLQRFTGSGLRDFDALVSEARRSVTRIERTITNIGEQPQSLIFGTSGTVKQYDGRRRR